MARGKIADAVKAGRILFSDGAWGTFLMEKGLKPGECPELWCVDKPEEVKDIASSYIGAGADMIQTNSFGGTRYKLGQYGLGERAAEINEAAARISREAAGDGCWVIASAGPTGKLAIMEEVTPEDYYDAYKEQAVALEKGGADAICIETMMAVDEAVEAVKAAKENTGLEVICTFTFSLTKKGEYRTLMGDTPASACRAAADAGADIIGTNCGNGMDRMIDIVKEIRAALPDMPIIAQANAGVPELAGGVEVFPETPETMAAGVSRLIEAGANIIGGCCGTTPVHIKAMKEAFLNQKISDNIK